MDYPKDALEIVDPKDVARKMVLDYSRGVKDSTTKSLETVCDLCWKIEQPHIDHDALIKETADQISRVFAIESVAIAVRDPVDGLYKYRIVIGVDKETADVFRNLTYTRAQLLDPAVYPGHEISRHTRLFLTEEHPFAPGEEATYRRPGLIGLRRRSLTDSLEADYLDFFFYGSDGEILGFIEASGTRLKKLPDSVTIRWIELIAGVLGAALQRKP